MQAAQIAFSQMQEQQPSSQITDADVNECENMVSSKLALSKKRKVDCENREFIIEWLINMLS